MMLYVLVMLRLGGAIDDHQQRHGGGTRGARVVKWWWWRHLLAASLPPPAAAASSARRGWLGKVLPSFNLNVVRCRCRRVACLAAQQAPSPGR